MHYQRMKDTRREIIIVTECVEMTWCTANIKYYQDLGYEFTRFYDKFQCLVCDLPPGSNKKVLVECPVCSNQRSIRYKSVIDYGNTLCQGCSHIKDLAEMTFGRLRVVDLDRTYRLNKKTRSHYWNCVCVCGNNTTVLGANLISGATVSCGCYNKELLSGENNWNWNPNLTSEERAAKRGYPAYERWRTYVFERDNYTCQICGEIGIALEAHHLYSYTAYPEYQLDVENGLTMCVDDHVNFHAWMGGKFVPCTPPDIDRWLYATS